MSSRRPSGRFFVAIVAASLFAGGSGFAISACSSTTTEAPAGMRRQRPRKTAAESWSTPRRPPWNAAKPQTPEQCFDACDKAHAASVPKYDAVDTCWTASCDDACNNMEGFDAGGADAEALDGGRVTDGGGLCGTPFGSGQDIACDDCTTINCCPEWKGCYGNADCQELENCYQDCP